MSLFSGQDWKQRVETENVASNHSNKCFRENKVQDKREGSGRRSVTGKLLFRYKIHRYSNISEERTKDLKEMMIWEKIVPEEKHRNEDYIDLELSWKLVLDIILIVMGNIKWF